MKVGVRTPTDKLVHRLRLMADAGGVITRDRLRIIIEAADRIEELDAQLHSQQYDRGGDEQ